MLLEIAETLHNNFLIKKENSFLARFQKKMKIDVYAHT